MEPYAPRQFLRLDSIKKDAWDLKQYAVIYGDRLFDRQRFHYGLAMATALLPNPARTSDRFGVGFIILHQGKHMDYVVLAWWDRENELPFRVFVHERNDQPWRPARGSESICVWDLEIIWAERTAYIETVLGTEISSARQRYLEWLSGHSRSEASRHQHG